MSIKYILKRKDLMAYYKKHLSENSFLFKHYIFGVALILALLNRYFYGPSHITNYNYISGETVTDGNYFVEVLVSLAVWVALIFVVRFIYLQNLENKIYSNPSLTGERELELKDDKLGFYTKDVRSEINITSIKKISELENYFFIYFETDSVIIIPKTTLGVGDFVNQIAIKSKINVC